MFPSLRIVLARVASVLAIVAVALTLAGCDKSIHGKYTGTMEGETITIDFKGDGKCTMTFNSDTKEGTYIQGETSITVDGGGMPMTLTIDGDSLVGPLGMRLVKK